ncbi:hypothetical protein HDU82_002074 [Entophlyctis luteolus]|nr:hypothetical protein HDU82_002074 [Entophlyctis luteolus]
MSKLDALLKDLEEVRFDEFDDFDENEPVQSPKRSSILDLEEDIQSFLGSIADEPEGIVSQHEANTTAQTATATESVTSDIQTDKETVGNTSVETLDSEAAVDRSEVLGDDKSALLRDIEQSYGSEDMNSPDQEDTDSTVPKQSAEFEGEIETSANRESVGTANAMNSDEAQVTDNDKERIETTRSEMHPPNHAQLMQQIRDHSFEKDVSTEEATAVADDTSELYDNRSVMSEVAESKVSGIIVAESETDISLAVSEKDKDDADTADNVPLDESGTHEVRVGAVSLHSDENNLSNGHLVDEMQHNRDSTASAAVGQAQLDDVNLESANREILVDEVQKNNLNETLSADSLVVEDSPPETEVFESSGATETDLNAQLVTDPVVEDENLTVSPNSAVAAVLVPEQELAASKAEEGPEIVHSINNAAFAVEEDEGSAVHSSTAADSGVGLDADADMLPVKNETTPAEAAIDDEGELEQAVTPVASQIRSSRPRSSSMRSPPPLQSPTATAMPQMLVSTAVAPHLAPPASLLHALKEVEYAIAGAPTNLSPINARSPSVASDRMPSSPGGRPVQPAPRPHTAQEAVPPLLKVSPPAPRPPTRPTETSVFPDIPGLGAVPTKQPLAPVIPTRSEASRLESNRLMQEMSSAEDATFGAPSPVSAGVFDRSESMASDYDFERNLGMENDVQVQIIRIRGQIDRTRRLINEQLRLRNMPTLLPGQISLPPQSPVQMSDLQSSAKVPKRDSLILNVVHRVVSVAKPASPKTDEIKAMREKLELTRKEVAEQMAKNQALISAQSPSSPQQQVKFLGGPEPTSQTRHPTQYTRQQPAEPYYEPQQVHQQTYQNVASPRRQMRKESFAAPTVSSKGLSEFLGVNVAVIPDKDKGDAASIGSARSGKSAKSTKSVAKSSGWGLFRRQSGK